MAFAHVRSEIVPIVRPPFHELLSTLDTLCFSLDLVLVDLLFICCPSPEESWSLLLR